MVKNKTLHMQKKSSKNINKTKLHPDLIPYSPTQEILNENFIASAVFECLKNNDPEGVMEILEGYLDTLNKSQVALNIDIPRLSLYYSLKKRNPTIKTLAKIVHSTSKASKRFR